MGVIELRKKLPKILSTPFWQDFMDVISVELENIRQEKIDPIKDTFNVEVLEDKERLLNVSSMLGYIPDLSLQNDTPYLKRDILSIPFRVKNKTTYVAYDHIFKLIPYTGQVFINFWNGYKLIRASENYLTGDYSLNYHDKLIPYVYVAEKNYKEIVFEPIFLDTSGLELDSDWFLDKEKARVPTKHMSIEFVIDKLIIVDISEFSMIPEYLDYLGNASNNNRKTTEVPQVGCQMSFLMDGSGFYDTYYPAYNPYSVDDIKMKCSTTTLFNDDESFEIAKYMVIGIGSHDMVSEYSGGTPIPNEIDNEVSKIELLLDEKEINNGWDLITTSFKGRSVRNEFIGDGNSVNTDFIKTLKNFPVLPGSLNISFTKFPVSYSIHDDGAGNLVSETAEGTINYENGDLSISLSKEYDDSNIITSNSVNSFGHITSQRPIKPSSVSIKYMIGQTVNEAYDDGFGNIYGDRIISGSINYDTGAIVVNLDIFTDASQNITIDYIYIVSSPPDLNTEILIDYRVTEDLLITEAGIIDENNDLIAYATFPPMVLSTFNNHMSFQFFVSKKVYSYIGNGQIIITPITNVDFDIEFVKETTGLIPIFIIGNANTLQDEYITDASGNIYISGNADTGYNDNIYDGSGYIQISGSAITENNLGYIASGMIYIGGNSVTEYYFSPHYISSGEISVSGTTDIDTFGVIEEGNGAIYISGSYHAAIEIVEYGAGLTQVTGSATTEVKTIVDRKMLSISGRENMNAGNQNARSGKFDEYS